MTASTRTGHWLLVLIVIVGTILSALPQPCSADQTPQARPDTTDDSTVWPLARFVPAELFTFGQHLPDEGPIRPEELDDLTTILNLANTIGVIPEHGRLYADIAASLPLLGRFDHAYALLSISAMELRENSYRLARMQMVLLIRTNGDNAAIMRQLQITLGHYFDTSTANIIWVGQGTARRQRLVDERLPDYAILEWAVNDDVFVLSFGEGAFDRYLAVRRGEEPSLWHDPWFKRCAHLLQSEQSMFFGYGHLARMRNHLEDVIVGRPAEVLDKLGGENARQIGWSLGFEQRAMRSDAIVQWPAGDKIHHLTNPSPDAQVMRLIPEDARSYAVFDRLDMPLLAERLTGALLAAHGYSWGRRISQWWHEKQQQYEVDFQKDLIDRLGKRMIIYDWPVHPLRWPVACTILIEHDGSQQVTRAVDALMASWQSVLHKPDDARTALSPTTQPADSSAKPPRRKWFDLQLKRHSSGIWYLQAGSLYLPGLAVNDTHIIISWSPVAVRDVLTFLNTSHGRRTHQPTTDSTSR